MNFTFEILRFFVYFIIGMIIFKWGLQRKGLEYDNKKIILFIILWKIIVVFILTGIEYINEQMGRVDLFLYYEEIVFFPIILVILSFIVNLLLGILLYEIIFKQIMNELIIIIIVVLEIIIDNCVLYPIFYFL